MRITNGMMINRMTQNLQQNLRKLDKTQLQYNTGKKIHKPSDDPIGITRALKLRADVNELKQYKKNAEDALSWIKNTEATIDGYVGEKGVLNRLRELTSQAANGVLTQEDTQKILSEVKELKEQIISIGNTTYSGNYVFSGKNTDKKLFDENGKYAIELNNNAVMAKNHIINFETGVGEVININTLGTALFEIEDPAGKMAGNKAGIIKLIENMEKALEEGETEKLTEYLGDIDKYMDKALSIKGDIGARHNRLKLVVDRAEDDIINLRALQSKIEDAELGETAIQLMNEENVYRASLSVGARIIQPTLLDFLR